MTQKITHYDLFAGIGGFSLALDTIFYEYERQHIFCEWEAFPTAVLKKHWPEETYYGDIADLVADTEREGWPGSIRQTSGRDRLRSRDGRNENEDWTILTGGFPCQPFSVAGRRKGTSDDRYKWPEMFEVIRNVKPDWIIAENVRGLVTWNDGMVLEQVCADLESEGYEVRPLIIPAVAVNAPHRRERVWIVANRADPRIKSVSERKVIPDVTANSRQQLRKSRSNEKMESDTTIRSTRPEANQREHQYTWEDNWREVAFATCHDRMDDGISYWLDGATLRGKRTDTISASRYRKERLKACGNAIVPQVAMQIFTAIKRTI